MTKVKGTHADSTDFDGPVDTGDAQGKRPADKKKNGDQNFDTEAMKKAQYPSGNVDTFPSGKVAEEVTALFDGIEGLSEGFAEKAGVIVEGAISEQVANLREELETEFENRLNEEIDNISSTLEEALDDYLNLVVENFLKENELAIDRGIKNDIAEQVIESMVAIVENAGVDLPEDKVDIAEELANTNAELEENLNESLNEVIGLRKELQRYIIAEAFAENTNGLTEAAKDKLQKLTENISYADVDDYVSKLNVLKESISETGATKPRANINEEVTIDSEQLVEQLDDRKRAYLEAAKNA